MKLFSITIRNIERDITILFLVGIMPIIIASSIFITRFGAMISNNWIRSIISVGLYVFCVTVWKIICQLVAIILSLLSVLIEKIQK